MDRRRRRTRALAGVALAALGGLALAADGRLPLQAMSWIPRDADPVRVFATQPTECLRVPADPAAARSVEIGRAAFRTPVLLGGQAARAGLSCESCHRSGRGNPDFQFPGASGGPGTADVTLSLFSSRRGNGVHDPRPIPDLSGPRERLNVASADLPQFIRGLVVEEFDGREPPPAVLAGLADYVRALGPAACPAFARERTSPRRLLDDARRAVRAAEASLAAGDPDGPTAALMIAAARARLFLIDERYVAQPAEVARLRAADARLAGLQAAARDGRPDAARGLARWRAASRDLEAMLVLRQPASLFDPDVLKTATNRRLPPKTS
ncbi:MAG: hypothetical protein EPO51_07955 [Phenylobacterium sp.]|uniref:hypothetical protein n=1 Tax=Phenylobacterium sp. TaxID=1871053 RepID=UPI0012182280|nr:hypothetical protein [Phenylobacterium sp.]TAJ72696.1 MAG: hypothetical protein EPO51_07955 [Phenylobacterium sp.]